MQQRRKQRQISTPAHRNELHLRPLNVLAPDYSATVRALTRSRLAISLCETITSALASYHEVISIVPSVGKSQNQNFQKGSTLNVQEAL